MKLKTNLIIVNWKKDISTFSGEDDDTSYLDGKIDALKWILTERNKDIVAENKRMNFDKERKELKL